MLEIQDMIEKQKDNDKKMTGKDDKKNMTKNTCFWQVSLSWIQNILRFFCHVFVMLLSCLIDFLDVFMILVCDVPFGFPCVTWNVSKIRGMK